MTQIFQKLLRNPPKIPTKPKIPYKIPMSAEEFLETAKRIACDYRVMNPTASPIKSKPITASEFMIREFKAEGQNYSAIVRWCHLDPLVYRVTWDADKMQYRLQVYTKIDQQTFTP